MNNGDEPGHALAAREIVRLLSRGRMTDGALSTMVVCDEVDGPAFRTALEVLEAGGLIELQNKNSWRLCNAQDHHRTS